MTNTTKRRDVLSDWFGGSFATRNRTRGDKPLACKCLVYKAALALRWHARTDMISTHLLLAATAAVLCNAQTCGFCGEDGGFNGAPCANYEGTCSLDNTKCELPFGDFPSLPPLECDTTECGFGSPICTCACSCVPNGEMALAPCGEFPTPEPPTPPPQPQPTPKPPTFPPPFPTTPPPTPEPPATEPTPPTPAPPATPEPPTPTPKPPTPKPPTLPPVTPKPPTPVPATSATSVGATTTTLTTISASSTTPPPQPPRHPHHHHQESHTDWLAILAVIFGALLVIALTWTLARA